MILPWILQMILRSIVRRILMRTFRARSTQREGAQAPDENPVFKIYGENEENMVLVLLRTLRVTRGRASA